MIGVEYSIAAYVLGLGLMLGYGLRVWWRLRVALRQAGGNAGAHQDGADSDVRRAEPASASRAR